MRRHVRDRLLLPLLLPIGILAFIAALLWAFSRILLGGTPTAATIIAIVAAIGVMVVAAAAAGRPTVRGSTIAAMFGATAGVAMLAGGIALAVVAGSGEGEGEEPDGEGAVIPLVAENIAFDPTQLTVPADEPFTIAFDNRDAGVLHNVQIHDNPDFEGTALFEGELISGPTQVEYAVDPLAPGTYSFLCIVHPTMTGTMEAVPGEHGGEGPGGEGEEGPGGGGGDPGSADVAVAARDIAFDTDTISLPADVPTTIAFDNQDAGVQHNVAIYRDESLGELLFQGQIFPGPEVVVYEVTALPAGEYYFQCDVHPNMNGTVTVG